MKKILLPVFILSFFIVNAQTFVSTSPENKNVILEEFTGISCVWCPAGHLIGQQMLRRIDWKAFEQLIALVLVDLVVSPTQFLGITKPQM